MGEWVRERWFGGAQAPMLIPSTGQQSTSYLVGGAPACQSLQCMLMYVLPVLLLLLLLLLLLQCVTPP